MCCLWLPLIRLKAARRKSHCYNVIKIHNIQRKSPFSCSIWFQQPPTGIFVKEWDNLNILNKREYTLASLAANKFSSSSLTSMFQKSPKPQLYTNLKTILFFPKRNNISKNHEYPYNKVLAFFSKFYGNFDSWKITKNTLKYLLSPRKKNKKTERKGSKC